MKVADIARLLAAPLEGDPERDIDGGAPLGAASATQLAFFDGRGATDTALASLAGCLLLPPDIPAPEGAAVIRVAKPRHAFAAVLRTLFPTRPGAPGTHPTAVVAASATLGEGASIGPHCVIEDEAVIGDGTTLVAAVWVGRGARIGAGGRLHHGVSVYPGVIVGERALVHAGARLGSDGFGFVFEGGRHEKFPQIGGLRIGDDVEIGANTAIDRGALGDSVIGDGVKLDNLVHIGHNCRIGNHVVIAAQTGFSGGVVVEDYVVMGGQVGVGEGATIGKAARVGGQAGPLPNHTLQGGQAYWGTPARPYREHMRKLALVERLPKLAAEVEALRARVKELEGK